VTSRKYGKVTNFSYHRGQYLPDWHPWEKVTDFFAGKRKTGGARELVPLELTWLTDIMGFPKKITGFYGKTMDLGANIDDTYVISMDFGGVFGNMVIDTVCRYSTMVLVLNMEKAQILWNWDENFIKLYNALTKQWKKYYFQIGKALKGYHKNLTEDMYLREIKKFINAIKGKEKFPNCLDNDIKVLKLLDKIEKNGC